MSDEASLSPSKKMLSWTSSQGTRGKQDLGGPSMIPLVAFVRTLPSWSNHLLKNPLCDIITSRSINICEIQLDHLVIFQSWVAIYYTGYFSPVFFFFLIRFPLRLPVFSQLCNHHTLNTHTSLQTLCSRVCICMNQWLNEYKFVKNETNKKNTSSSCNQSTSTLQPSLRRKDLTTPFYLPPHICFYEFDQGWAADQRVAITLAGQ